MKPAYMRRSWAPWLLLIAAVFCLLLSLAAVMSAMVERSRERGKTEAYQTVQRVADSVAAIDRGRWVATLDSLGDVLVVRDSLAGAAILETTRAADVLRRRLASARAAVDTVRDTVAVEAATTNLLRACAETVTTCENYRASSSAALAVADSVRVSDLVSVRGLSASVAALDDSLRVSERKRGGRWTAAAWGFVTGSVVTVAAVVVGVVRE